MDISRYMTRTNFVRAFIAVALISIVFIAYDNLSFRVKDVSPSLSNMPDSATEIRFNFSQPIESVGSVVINDEELNVEIRGKTVAIPVGGLLESDVLYTVVLNDVKSKWFNNSIQSIGESFTPKYVAYNKLSDKDKRAQIAESNSGQVDDPFISESVFPIFNERWQIDATVNSQLREASLRVKFFEEIPNYDNGGAITRVSNEVAEKYRQEVLAEIKKRNGNPDDYGIFYDNPYLADKYRSTEEH